MELLQLWLLINYICRLRTGLRSNQNNFSPDRHGNGLLADLFVTSFDVALEGRLFEHCVLSPHVTWHQIVFSSPIQTRFHYIIKCDFHVTHQLSVFIKHRCLNAESLQSVSVNMWRRGSGKGDKGRRARFFLLWCLRDPHIPAMGGWQAVLPCRDQNLFKPGYTLANKQPDSSLSHSHSRSCLKLPYL